MRAVLRALVALVAVAALGSGGAPVAAQDSSAALPRAALIIGNANYRAGGIPDLDNPLNDIRAVNSSLAELGFGVTALEDGDAATMRAALDRIPRAFPEGGVGLVYYAGHAVQYRGVNYLLPTDFELTTPEQLPAHAVALNDLLRALERARIKVAVVILDACRDNPFGDVSGAFGQGLALADAPGETLIAYATRPGGVAEDGIGANSPYTAAFVAALELPGQDVEDVFRLVASKVRRATEGRQIPWILGSLESQIFLRAPEPVSPPEVAGLAGGQVTLAAADWNTIRKSVDPTDFQRFLADHGDAGLASLASNRLRELAQEGRQPLAQMEILPQADGPPVPGGLNSLVTECDILAAEPYDPGRITAGVPRDLVNTRVALRACAHALAREPENPRLLATFGRVLDIAERFSEAESYYRRAIEYRYGSSLWALGYIYRTGRGRPKDDVEAARLYREAALLGNQQARTALAKLYLEGWGVPQSDREALHWYRLAGDYGYPPALDSLGNMYLRGRGVEQDLARAAEYYLVAAQLGHSNAMENLGRLYREGKGVPKDFEQSVRWLARAMEEGNPYAPYQLGRMFRRAWGVERDDRQALSHFKLSADRGFAEAYAELAEMHEKGEGTPVDKEEAYYLYYLAREGGLTKNDRNALAMAAAADERLKALRRELGGAVADRVAARADEWLEQNGRLQFLEIVQY